MEGSYKEVKCFLSGVNGFREGREKVEDERNGCPRSYRTQENVEKVLYLVDSGTCLNISAMAVQLYLYKETVKKA
jgi:hypothetical protein